MNLLKWKCNICKNAYKAFDFKCSKRQDNKDKIKKTIKTKLLYYVVKTIKANKTTIILVTLRSATMFN